MLTVVDAGVIGERTVVDREIIGFLFPLFVFGNSNLVSKCSKLTERWWE
jgi:hypothetical protein